MHHSMWNPKLQEEARQQGRGAPVGAALAGDRGLGSPCMVLGPLFQRRGQ